MTARRAVLIFLITVPASAAGPPWLFLDLGGLSLETLGPGQAAKPAAEDAYAKPVTRQQVTDLVGAGMSSAKLAPIVVRRGINFEPTPADLAALRKAGATEALIQALGDAPQFIPSGSVLPERPERQAAPAPPAGKKSQPASSASGPLDKLKLLRLVVRGTLSTHILDLVETAGLSFTPTDEFLDTLKIAGADEAVRAAVHSFAAGKRLEIPSTFADASGQPATAVQVGDEKTRIYQAGEDITSPKGLYTPDAPYTEEARRHRIEGKVVLEIVVERSGNVSDVRVAQSLDPGLDASAVKTVRNWRFEPATRDGRAVRVAVHVEINFKLRDSPKAVGRL
jgi:TonB family protein